MSGDKTEIEACRPRKQGHTTSVGRKTGGATTKTARLEALLRRPRGATMPQLERNLGWQPHTVRAAISRLRKGGAKVVLEQSGKTPAYRIEIIA